MADIFQNHNPNAGLAPNLIPTPPAAVPTVQTLPWEQSSGPSPFQKAQDVNNIIAQLSLDRPLPLFIPNRDKYRSHQFHIINDTPQEYAVAQRAGWRPVDDPELVALFEGKVSGSDKHGRPTKPILMARENVIGAHEMRLKRQKLAALVSGLDPKNRQFNSQNAKNVTSGPDASEGVFRGAGMGRIIVR